MRKEDCKKGMLVYFGDVHRVTSRFSGATPRGVVIKVNPKRAKIQSIDPAGRWWAGSVWSWPYSLISPVVGGDEIESEMTMRSFQEPESMAVKAWSAAQKSQEEISRELVVEDAYIMRAIHEIYTKLEGTEGRARISLSEKINILFRAFGREVTKNEAQEWVSR